MTDLIVFIGVGASSALATSLALTPRLQRRAERAFRGWRRAWMARRRRPILRKQWADALAFLAGGLKAGLTVEAALDSLCREAPEPLRSHARERWSESDRWKPTELRIRALLDDEQLALARASLLLARRGGGQIAQLLEIASAVSLKRLEAEERAEALTLPLRSSAWVIGLSPVGLMAAIALLSPDYLAPLFTTRSGAWVLVLISALVPLGLYLVHRLARPE